MGEQKLQQKSGAPEWATEPFTRFVDQAERLHDVVLLSVKGISMARAMPKAVGAIARAVGTKGTANHKLELEAAQLYSEVANREIASGFQLMYSFATVALWSLLEAMLTDAVVSRFRNDPEVFTIEAVRKLRIRLGEYEQLSQDDRYHYVAELLEADVAASVRNGIERFEAMLRPFRLDGAVPESMRRDVFEFGQVRNAIVHGGRKADYQLSKACPWLGLIVGQDLAVGRKNFERYQKASHGYVVLLVCRVGEQFGVSMQKERNSVFSDYGEEASEQPSAKVSGD